MADPLSITASALTVAAAGYKVATTLFTLVGRFRNSSAEILLIATEISTFFYTFENLHDYLVDVGDIFSEDFVSSMRNVLHMCSQIYADINKIIKNEIAGRHAYSIRNFMWAFHREKLLSMRSNMETAKTTLLVLHNITKLGKHREACRTRYKFQIPALV